MLYNIHTNIQYNIIGYYIVLYLLLYILYPLTYIGTRESAAPSCSINYNEIYPICYKSVYYNIM